MAIIEILGHVMQLLGIFFAFMAVGFGFIYSNLIRGGIAGRSAFLGSIGYLVLAIDIFFIYGGAITGQLNLLEVTLFWPLLGFLTATGFFLIGYSNYSLWRVTS